MRERNLHVECFWVVMWGKTNGKGNGEEGKQQHKGKFWTKLENRRKRRQEEKERDDDDQNVEDG
jgi:hypothetical protein